METYLAVRSVSNVSNQAELLRSIYQSWSW